MTAQVMSINPDCAMWSEDAEQAVLSAMLVDRDATIRGVQLVDGSMFHAERHRRIFLAMVALTERGSIVDPITLWEELSLRGDLDAIGGREYVGYLIDAAPTAANIDHHADIVRDRYQRRSALKQLEHERDAILSGTPTVAEIRNQGNAILSRIAGSSRIQQQSYSLADLLERPELLQPPEVIAPKLAWRGRTTLFAGREKIGKSTFMGWVASSISNGNQMFGEAIASGPVLWVGLEEHLADAVQRFRRLHAKPHNIFVIDRLPRGLDTLRAVIRHREPVIAFVDTLAALVNSIGGDKPRDAADWTPIMDGIARIARELDTAIILNAHARKSDGSYRDSSAIGAGVDMVLTMLDKSNGKSSERQILAVGRWDNPGFSVRLESTGTYNIVGAGDGSLEMRVLDYVRLNPKASKSAVRHGVEAQAAKVDAALRALCDRGIVIDTITAGAHQYELASVSRATALRTASPDRYNSLWDMAGQGVGQPALSSDPTPMGSERQGNVEHELRQKQASDFRPGTSDAV